MGVLINVQTPACPVCNETSTIPVDSAQYLKWKHSQFIQHAFSDMDADTRELLMTGTHAKCWDAMFPPDDEEPPF